MLENLIESHAKPSFSTKEALLEAVFADPKNDDARLVYADFLQECDDPHGEFIRLQIDRAQSPATNKQTTPGETKRERQLFDKNWRDFLGPLADVVQKSSLKFERGFAHKVAIKGTGPKPAASAGSPYWSTVKEFNGPHFIFSHPVMKSLECLTLSDIPDIEKVLEGSQKFSKIKTLKVPCYWSAREWLNEDLLRSFPKLREFWIREIQGEMPTVSRFLRSPKANTIRSIGVLARPPYLGKYPSLVSISRSFGLLDQADQVERMYLSSFRSGPSACLSRDKEGAFSHLQFKVEPVAYRDLTRELTLFPIKRMKRIQYSIEKRNRKIEANKKLEKNFVKQLRARFKNCQIEEVDEDELF